MDVIHPLRHGVIRFHFLIADRPGEIPSWRRNSQKSSRRIQRGAEQFGRTADEMVHLRLKRPALAVYHMSGETERLCSNTAAASPFSASLQPVAALENQRVLAQWREMRGDRASPAPLITSNRLSMPPPLLTVVAVHDPAIREDRRCGNIAPTVSGKERHQSGNLFRARHPSQRYACI